MNNGYERRRHRRLPLNLTIEVSKLYKQDYISLDNINVDIEVVDISKSGIGFCTKKELPIDYYFDSKIELGESDFFYAVIKIVRSQQLADGSFNYGAQFVGLAPFLADKIDMYARKVDGNLNK